MSKTSSFLLAAVVSVFVRVVAGCAPREVGKARASRVWADAPRDGVRLPEPTPLPVMAHGAMPDGVREMELLADARFRVDMADEALGSGPIGVGR